MIYFYGVEKNVSTNEDTLKDYMRSHLDEGIILELSPNVVDKVEKFFNINIEEIYSNPLEYSIEVDNSGFNIIPSTTLSRVKDGESVAKMERVYLLKDQLYWATRTSFKSVNS